MVARLWLLLAAVQHCAAFDFDDEEEVSVKDVPAGSAAPVFFDDDATGITADLEHSFDGKTFSPRGKLFYRDSKPYTDTSGAGRASARAAQAKLNGANLEEFQRLLTTGGHYTLRMPSVLNDAQSPPVFASVSVCSLMASRFEERLHLSLASSGRVSGLSYILPVATMRCPSAGLPRLALDEALFNTTVSVSFPEEGATPIGRVPEQGFLPPEARAKLQKQQAANGVGGEGGQGPGQEPQANQSFLRRYWMYILPAVIMLSMGGGEPPAESGDKAGGVSARPAAAAAGGKRK